MILTDVDRLMSLLQTQSPLKVADMAKELVAPRAKVDALVGYLEQAGLVKAVYHLFGTSVYLLPQSKNEQLIRLKSVDTRVPAKQASPQQLMHKLEELRKSLEKGSVKKLTGLAAEFNALVRQANKSGLAKDKKVRSLTYRIYELMPRAKSLELMGRFEKSKDKKLLEKIDAQIAYLEKVQDRLVSRFKYAVDKKMLSELKRRRDSLKGEKQSTEVTKQERPKRRLELLEKLKAARKHNASP